ncbi:MAG: CRISPR-associated primase-polymerase type B [bacterium]|nr:CRISPR-associated primase-polymerase type B [bacterium]
MIELQFGQHITSIEEALKTVSLERLYQGIRHPKPQFLTQIKRLRMVRAMDPRQYAKLKKQLPYFVCGRFHPAIRRKEHFSSIECFVIDLDHFEGSGLRREEVAEAMRSDDRSLMVFTSPGGDGLKVMFRLQERCFDPGMYSYFYKAFLQKLIQQYDLAKVADLTTHDVSRACFLSVDNEAYFNPGAQPVSLSQYFDPFAPEVTKVIRDKEQELKQRQAVADIPEPKEDPLSKEVLDNIKKKLNPNFKPRPPKKEAHVPLELESQIPALSEKLQEAGITLREAVSINYGKQLKLEAMPLMAEINVFFGKRGFSVVKTTKTGTSAELADLAYQVIMGHLFPNSSTD